MQLPDAILPQAVPLQYGFAACPDARTGHPPERLHTVNETVPLRGQAPSTLLLDVRHAGVTHHFRPQSSIIMIVHNAAPALAQSLPRIFNHTLGCAELLLLLDQCNDGSLAAIVRHLATGFRSSRIRRVRVLQQPTPIWEAAAENVLMSISNPLEAYVLVQPDNLVAQRGWDIQLLRPLWAHDDVVGVSGFLAHAFGAATPTMRHLKFRPYIRDPGYNEAKPDKLESSNAFYVRDTGSRGPLLLHADRTRQLGFFDHELFWLEDSDHDLFCRAHRLHGWVVGAVKVHSVSPMHLKTKTHGERVAPQEARNESGATLRALKERAAAVRMTGRRSCLQNGAWVSRMQRTPPRSEIRPLPLMGGLDLGCAERGHGALNRTHMRPSGYSSHTRPHDHERHEARLRAYEEERGEPDVEGDLADRDRQATDGTIGTRR